MNGVGMIGGKRQASIVGGSGIPPRPCSQEAKVERIGRTMRIDHWTVLVVDALRSAGIRSLLLKGPVVADWLYGGDRAARPYNDADLMVAPSDYEPARSVLAGLGFACIRPLTQVATGAPLRHAECWFRAHDHAAVDPHLSLHGTERLDPRVVWSVVSRAPDEIQLHGTPVEAPGEAVRTLHLVLHLRPKDQPGTKAWSDLERGIAVVDERVWRSAVGVAAELQVEAAMGVLLRRLPEGRVLADLLDLPSVAPLYLALEYDSSAPGSAKFLSRVRSAGPRMGAALLIQKVLPAPDDVRCDWPFARRGPVFLAAAYGWRWLLTPVRLYQWGHFHSRRRSMQAHERRSARPR